MSEQMQEDQTEDLICSHKAIDLVAFYKFTQVSSVDLLSMGLILSLIDMLYFNILSCCLQ